MKTVGRVPNAAEAKSGGGVLGEGTAIASSTPARGSGERCELPAGFGAEPLPPKVFSDYFQHSGWPLDPDTIILYYC